MRSEDIRCLGEFWYFSLQLLSVTYYVGSMGRSVDDFLDMFVFPNSLHGLNPLCDFINNCQRYGKHLIDLILKNKL